MNIGEISYTNILPLYFYLDREKLTNAGVTFTNAVPAKVNKMMEEQKVDIGGISSFSFGKHADQYRIFPDLSVSAFGKVNSIFLFSKFPLESLSGKRIALTSSSETSVALLKVILHHFYQVQVAYETEPPVFEKMMDRFDACLLIGDDAIQAKRKNHSFYSYDLGEIWYEKTGFPMTFAVMAYRKEKEIDEIETLNEIYLNMVESKKRCSEENFLPLIDRVLDEHGGDFEFWKSYFNGLNYQFTGEHEKGLNLYFKLAKECGLLQTQPVITKFSYK